jgi:hypothetical protein
MKKRFLFFVSAVSFLLFGTWSARAVELSDGAVIKIGTEQLIHEDISNWNPTGKSAGSIRYDETTHTLTLDGATITQELFIDASDKGGFAVTIQVVGSNYIQVTNANGIHFADGDDLIIEGTADAALYIYASGAYSKVGAILCAKDNNYSMLSDWEVFPLTIKGGLMVSANNMDAEGTAHTVYCGKATIDHSPVYARNKLDCHYDAFMTKGMWSDNEFLGVNEWYWNDYYERVFFLPYTEQYPIIIDGMQLTDQITELDNQWLQAIKKGSISYDPATRVLTLTDLEMEVPHSGEVISILNTESEVPITMVVNSPVTPVKLTSTTNNSASDVLFFKGKAILDLNGCYMELSSEKGIGLELSEAELTICNTLGTTMSPDLAEKATLEVKGKGTNGKGIYTSDTESRLIIDHANVSTIGTKGSLILATTEKGVTLSSTHHWNSDHNKVLDYTENTATDWVKFDLSEWQLSAVPFPKGKGSIHFQEGGSDVDNPYLFDNDKNITMTAVPIDGWKFMMWEDAGIYKYEDTRSVHVTTGSGSQQFTSWFGKKPATETEWIAVYYDGITYQLMKYENGFTDLINPIGDIPVTSGNGMLCADFANGHFYYIETTSLGNTISLFKAPFDGTTLGTPEKVIDGGTEYIFFDDLTYNAANNWFYGACSRSADFKSVIVRIYPDGTITEEAEIPTGYSINALVCAGDGTLYATYMYSGDLKWGKITFSGSTMTIDKIGDMDDMPVNITGSNYTSMCYDNLTEELFLFDSEMSWSLSKSDAAIDPVNVKSGRLISVFSTVTPEAKLIAKPVEAGSGSFRLESTGGTYENEGTFEPGTTVKVTAIPASGFVFARWMDDTDWKDAEKRKNETRELTLTGGTITLTALFYYQHQSIGTWYGVSEAANKFVSFVPGELAYEVTKASKPSGSSVKAGEFIEDSWCYVDGTDVKLLPFEGDFDNGDDLTKDKTIETLATGAPSEITDIAYDLINKEVYAVAASDLYRVNSEKKQLDKLGTLKYKSKTVSGVGITIDVSGTIYILAQGATPGDEGVLYTVDDIDETGKKVTLALVGAEEDGGKVGVIVTGDAQSIAFDHATGEIFWGASDYLRVFDLVDAKAHIAGDLGQTGGAQGYIKSLHKRDRAVTVKVQVDEDQEDRGTVSIGTGSKTKGTFIVGTKTTITATPNEGYRFDYWTKKQGSTEKDLKDDEREQAKLTVTVSGAVTYIAHFAKKAQGIDEVESQELRAKSQKLIIDGQLYLMYEGKMYNVQGLRME